MTELANWPLGLQLWNMFNDNGISEITLRFRLC